MRRLRPLLMAALVFLFLAEGQRAFFASLLAAVHDALLPSAGAAAVLLAAAPLLLVLAPLLPLARWLDRHTVVATAAIGVGVFRLVVMASALPARLIGGGLVLAAAALFLTWAVGLLDRRALGGGLVVGLAVDQLLRLAGASYDLSLQPVWLPVQAVLSLALIALAVLWTRSAASTTRRESEGEARGEEDWGDELKGGGGREAVRERRAGGLRLRGALALGTLLFMDLHVLGLPPVVAQWTGVAYPAAGVAVGIASAAAVAAALLLGRPSRGRLVTLLLVGLVTAGALAGYWAGGGMVAGLMAAAHFAALLLMTRAVDPASGRRGGSTTAVGFALFALTTALYGLTFFPAAAAPLPAWTVPWIFAGAGLVLAACFILLPRPEAIRAPASAAPAVALALLLAFAAGILSLAGAVPASVTAAEAGRSAAPIRVATWTVRYGFDQDWRFDPGAVAATVSGLEADVIALREVPVATPLSYGVDLPLWIGRRAGLRSQPSPGPGGVAGGAGIHRGALLTRLDGRFESVRLPGDGAGPGQLLRLRTDLASATLTFALPQPTTDGPAAAAQMTAAMEAVGAGPAVLLGVDQGGSDGPLTDVLARAGFHHALGDLSRSRPDHSAGHTAGVRNGIWLRGLRADTATLGAPGGGGHRPLTATLHIDDVRIRSSDANDLQTSQGFVRAPTRAREATRGARGGGGDRSARVRRPALQPGG